MNKIKFYNKIKLRGLPELQKDNGELVKVIFRDFNYYTDDAEVIEFLNECVTNKQHDCVNEETWNNMFAPAKNFFEWKAVIYKSHYVGSAIDFAQAKGFDEYYKQGKDFAQEVVEGVKPKRQYIKGTKMSEVSN